MATGWRLANDGSLFTESALERKPRGLMVAILRTLVKRLSFLGHSWPALAFYELLPPREIGRIVDR
jgi:hypothetical protein